MYTLRLLTAPRFRSCRAWNMLRYQIPGNGDDCRKERYFIVTYVLLGQVTELLSGGAHIMIYPGAFNMTTGPLHWELLQRGRQEEKLLYYGVY